MRISPLTQYAIQKASSLSQKSQPRFLMFTEEPLTISSAVRTLSIDPSPGIIDIQIIHFLTDNIYVYPGGGRMTIFPPKSIACSTRKSQASP
jgi:hypothetical protein